MKFSLLASKDQKAHLSLDAHVNSEFFLDCIHYVLFFPPVKHLDILKTK